MPEAAILNCQHKVFVASDDAKALAIPQNEDTRLAL